MHMIESYNTYYKDQDFYIDETEQIQSDAEYDKLASIKMKLEWLANTWPDIVFKVSQIVQAERSMYEREITKHCKHHDLRATVCAT